MTRSKKARKPGFKRRQQEKEKKGQQERKQIKKVDEDDVPLSQEELQHASELLSQNEVVFKNESQQEQEEDEERENPLPFAGFTRASGKPVAPPNEALIETVSQKLLAVDQETLHLASASKGPDEDKLKEEKTPEEQQTLSQPKFSTASGSDWKDKSKENSTSTTISTTTNTSALMDASTEKEESLPSLHSWQSLGTSPPMTNNNDTQQQQQQSNNNSVTFEEKKRETPTTTEKEDQPPQKRRKEEEETKK